MPIQYSFGPRPEENGTQFRMWAPQVQSLEVVLYIRDGTKKFYPMDREGDAIFTCFLEGVGEGARYKFRLNGEHEFPDPASPFQPEGVHGPSEVMNPASYSWSDDKWQGIALDKVILYELHIGTFTPEGTFAAVIEKLPEIVDLGVTAIEFLPVADFPGERNWGYDGDDLYAPARCYGRPDDLRRLVDAAHNHGLAVFQDVVYNHLGPDGNYLGCYFDCLYSQRHKSPWGAGLNLDEEGSRQVRDFFIENAIYWLSEFHFDGLRLDATHAIVDESDPHFLAELTTRVREEIPDRKIHLVAEDHRNLAHMAKPISEGGWGLDGIWADDFHHQMRSLLAGDNEGYYRDFSGSTDDVATTINQGWFFCGQESIHLEGPRGTNPVGLPPQAFFICLQNHDQIGNRAFGERIHHQINLAAYRAASALLLCSPQTPYLFMGQEWAASTPFLYFTDHEPDLGKKVTHGRRQEFRHFSAFSDPKVRETIPDPQAEETFALSKLRWEERDLQPHAEILKLYQALLQFRRTEPALQSADPENFSCVAAGDSIVVLERRKEGAPAVLVICHFQGEHTLDTTSLDMQSIKAGKEWEIVLTTEDQAYAMDFKQPKVVLKPAPVIQFFGPVAVILREVN